MIIYILKVCTLDFTIKEFPMICNNGQKFTAIYKLNELIRMEFQSTFTKELPIFFCIKNCIFYEVTEASKSHA
jgi:hypothetical protein